MKKIKSFINFMLEQKTKIYLMMTKSKYHFMPHFLNKKKDTDG